MVLLQSATLYGLSLNNGRYKTHFMGSFISINKLKGVVVPLQNGITCAFCLNNFQNYLKRFASSINGRFSDSLNNFHSAPRRFEISELCIFGFSCAIFLRCPLDHTINAFMGRFMCSWLCIDGGFDSDIITLLFNKNKKQQYS